MASSSLILFIFFIATATHYSLMVNGDAALIHDVCNKTEESKYCGICFDSNPQSSQADVRGLAGIAINCSYAQSFLSKQYLVGYATSAPNPQETKIFVDCAIDFTSIAQLLSSALENWRNMHYEECTSQLTNAIAPYYERCIEKIIYKSEITPNPFADVLQRTGAFCMAAIGVVAQIP